MLEREGGEAGWEGVSIALQVQKHLVIWQNSLRCRGREQWVLTRQIAQSITQTTGF